MANRKAVEQAARRIRAAVIEMTTNAGSGHPGGSLGAADILASLYLGKVMTYSKSNPNWLERDYFILSNGHLAPAWYAALAEAGCIPRKELKTLRQFGSRLQGHPVRGALPQVEVSTGSLGQGVGVAVGIAKGLRMQGRKNRVYCSIGDGELEEGSCWEAIMAAGHYKLDNLIMFIDRNKLQQNGNTEEIMALEPLEKKLAAFNVNVIVADGNDVGSVIGAFHAAKSMRNKPTAIVFLTTMGKGVPFMEGDHQWHGKALPPEKAVEALKHIEAGNHD